jgi:hypothetical protein
MLVRVSGESVIARGFGPGRFGRKIAGRDGFGLDFKAVFHDVDPRLVSYIEMDAAVRSVS